jgi:uncharacterized tellurite resistance protein B-like protein
LVSETDSNGCIILSMHLTTKWQLVACGLVAHADGVLDGEECDRLMTMVDEEVDGDEYSSWLTAVADADRLRALLDQLEVPSPESHREILEHGWNMSIVDGERCEAENAILEQIADRLGVEPMQLDFWREAWAAAEHDTAEWIAAALGWVLGGGGEPPGEDRSGVRKAVTALPTTDDHRDALVVLGCSAQSREHVVRRLSKLSPRKRRWALARIAPATIGATDESAAHQRFVELAAELGIAASRADALLRA